MSFKMGSSKTKTSQKSQTDPWDVTIPYITDFLGKVPNAQGPTADQIGAIDDLKTQVSAGNPNAGAIMDLANDQLGTQSQSGMVKTGYEDLTRRLTPTADGSNLDLENNAYLQRLLTQVGDDAAMRTNAQFAAAGRDLSGANQMAVGKGVTQAQLPLLLDQYNRELARSDAAARDLYGASGTTASSITALDAAANAERAKGIDTTNAALEAQAYGPTQILNLDEQLKGLTYDELDRIAALLYPAAKLGEQSSGTGTSKMKSTGFGLSLADIGKVMTGLGA